MGIRGHEERRGIASRVAVVFFFLVVGDGEASGRGMRRWTDGQMDRVVGVGLLRPASSCSFFLFFFSELAKRL